MKTLFLLSFSFLFLVACSNRSPSDKVELKKITSKAVVTAQQKGEVAPSYEENQFVKGFVFEYRTAQIRDKKETGAACERYVITNIDEGFVVIDVQYSSACDGIYSATKSRQIIFTPQDGHVMKDVVNTSKIKDLAGQMANGSIVSLFYSSFGANKKVKAANFKLGDQQVTTFSIDKSETQYLSQPGSSAHALLAVDKTKGSVMTLQCYYDPHLKKTLGAGCKP